MTLTKEQIEQIARTVHAATSASHNCDCPHRPWGERSEESKENMIWFVKVAFFFGDIHDVHQVFCTKWIKEEGYKYGEEKSKEQKTHPLLVPFGELPDSAVLNLKLLVSITRTMVEHYKSIG